MENINDGLKIRLDKWLWAARFFKTRKLAKNAIEGGKVHYNGKKCKVSKIIELKALITIKQGVYEKKVIVKNISDQRKTFSEASLLYEETQDSINKREEKNLQLKCGYRDTAPTQKPNKKDRRAIIKFKQKPK